MPTVSRRSFIGSAAAASLLAIGPRSSFARQRESKLSFGLVTYMWGHDWDLPTLIENCEKTGTLGVELRTTHAHGVESTLNEQQRAEVRERFADSEVVMVGIGSNERFDSPDAATLRKAIEASKEFIRLSHDVGGTGVKVKPDRFYPDVPREKTIEQIGRALNELGEYGEGFGQQVRLEVHGQCAGAAHDQGHHGHRGSSQRRRVLELEPHRPPRGRLGIQPQPRARSLRRYLPHPRTKQRRLSSSATDRSAGEVRLRRLAVARSFQHAARSRCRTRGTSQAVC